MTSISRIRGFGRLHGKSRDNLVQTLADLPIIERSDAEKVVSDLEGTVKDEATKVVIWGSAITLVTALLMVKYLK